MERKLTAEEVLSEAAFVLGSHPLFDKIHELLQHRDAEIARLTEDRDALRGFAREMLYRYGHMPLAKTAATDHGLMDSDGAETPLLTGEDSNE